MNEILSQIHDSNLERFLSTYKKNLKIEVETKPDEYAWNISELDAVFERMKVAIIRGSYNKDSSTFKKTCKELKIKHTYKDIDCYIKSIS